MPYDLTTEELIEERNRQLGDAGSEFYKLLGYYTHHYCVCEAFITSMLGMVLEMKDAQKFALLVRGMDARTKCERLRKAAAMFCPLEAKLDARIIHFVKFVIPIRNNLMHSWPVLNDGIIYFTTVNTDAPGMEIPKKDFQQPLAPSINANEFFRQALWMWTFGEDLLRATDNFLDHKHLGIIAPHSSLPKTNLPKKRKATKR